LACGWLEPLPRPRTAVKAHYSFRDRSVRQSLVPLLGVRQLAEPQRRSSLVSRAARRSLKAPDSGSGNARRKASPTWPAACFGSIGARRAARSAEVDLSTTPPPGNRFQNPGSLSEVPEFSIPIGAKWLRFSAIFGPEQRVGKVLLEAPKGVFEAAHKTFASRPLAGWKRLRHSARALKHSAGA